MTGIISLILGVIALVGGVWMVGSIAVSPLTIVGGLIIALGVALVVSALAIGFDKVSPTSRRLGR